MDYQRIPIYGEQTRDQLIELHRQKLYQFDPSTKEYTNKQMPIGIHYDVYLTSKEDLNIIMFELLFLGSLSD